MDKMKEKKVCEKNYPKKSKKSREWKGKEKGQEEPQPSRGPGEAPAAALLLTDDLQDAERRLKCSSLQSTQGPILIPLSLPEIQSQPLRLGGKYLKAGDRTLQWLKSGGDRGSWQRRRRMATDSINIVRVLICRFMRGLNIPCAG